MENLIPLVLLFFTLVFYFFWGILGLGLGKFKEGLVTFVVSLVVLFLPSWLFGTSKTLSFVNLFLQYIPPLAFGFLVFTNKLSSKTLWIMPITLGTYLFFKSSILGFVFDIIENGILLLNPDIDTYYINYLVFDLFIVLQSFLVIAISFWFIDRLQRGVTPVFRSLDLSIHNYTNFISTVIFFSSKWIVLLAVIPISKIVSQYPYRDPTTILEDITFILNGIQGTLGLFAIAAFLRCLLAEFLISKGYKIGWHFIFLMFPIIGEVLWLSILTKGRNKFNIDDRIKVLKSSLSINIKSLKLFFFALTGLSLVAVVLFSNPLQYISNLRTIIISMIMFALYLYFRNSKTIYWMLGFTCLLFFSTIYHKQEIQNMDSLYEPYSMIFTSAIVLMVVFHLKAFKIYPFVEEEIMNDDYLVDELIDK